MFAGGSGIASDFSQIVFGAAQSIPYFSMAQDDGGLNGKERRGSLWWCVFWPSLREWA